VRTATTFKEKSAKDFREPGMMTPAFDFGFSALRLLNKIVPTSPLSFGVPTGRLTWSA